MTYVTLKRGRPPKPRTMIDNSVDQKLFYLLASREEQAQFEALLAGDNGQRNATAYVARLMIRELPAIVAKARGLDEALVGRYMRTPKKDWDISDWR